MGKFGCKAQKKHLPPQTTKAFLVILSQAQENTSQQPGFYYPGPILKMFPLSKVHSHVHNTHFLPKVFEMFALPSACLTLL